MSHGFVVSEVHLKNSASAASLASMAHVVFAPVSGGVELGWGVWDGTRGLETTDVGTSAVIVKSHNYWINTYYDLIHYAELTLTLLTRTSQNRYSMQYQCTKV